VRTPKRMIALCALLTVTACGTTAPHENAATTSYAGAATSVRVASGLGGAAPVRTEVGFGTDFRFQGGVAVSVATPRSFRPSATAYPQSARAVAFEIVLRNDGDQPYRLSGLTVAATVAGQQAKQVVDATQGYNGIVDAGKDVLPGRNVRVILAFAVPEVPAEVALAVRPATASPDAAMYCGSV
jgi:hypothetical protein